MGSRCCASLEPAEAEHEKENDDGFFARYFAPFHPDDDDDDHPHDPPGPEDSRSILRLPTFSCGPQGWEPVTDSTISPKTPPLASRRLETPSWMLREMYPNWHGGRNRGRSRCRNFWCCKRRAQLGKQYKGE